MFTSVNVVLGALSTNNPTITNLIIPLSWMFQWELLCAQYFISFQSSNPDLDRFVDVMDPPPLHCALTRLQKREMPLDLP